ncbi:Putative exonuclease, RdgC [Desulfuromusa kysingii]|uniref:Putative exonuclease, RdgC n=1 Tax=Desulfuromusa kysingii TaxID=37625 RepID=A0A1H3ZMB0_9BACT|nr:recombination-associated protein RdgC [Desulfuromusa kysingii]SEA24541.1 Putative exonuclease, RdgC [Desulfuromusa kysingii]
MGFLATSASICYFQVTGTLDPQTKLQELADKLTAEGFRSIEQSADELATGWVELDNYDSSEFSSSQQCWRDHYLCFSLRQDRRRIPAALLKRQIVRLCDKFLEENPTLNYVPKGEKEQIRDQARTSLLARTLPTPSFYDVVWDTDQQLLRFCSLGQNTIDSFQGLFHQTFPGLRLQIFHPLARAIQVLPEQLRDSLQQANKSQTENVLEQIEANRWLGTDFLQWLFYRTLNSDSRYQVTTEGPLLEKQPFTAFLDNRLVLVGGGQEGVQKIVVAGPQDQYREVRAALQQGKQIEEATIHLQQNEDDCWKLTLKGERFQFGSYRTPMIRPDKDPNDDPQAEAEAAFFTKIASIEEGEQMFNSLLKSFLELRLGEQWAAEQAAILTWLNE